MSRFTVVPALVLASGVFWAAGCGDDDSGVTPSNDGGPDTGRPDGATPPDSGGVTDGGGGADATVDAGPPEFALRATVLDQLGQPKTGIPSLRKPAVAVKFQPTPAKAMSGWPGRPPSAMVPGAVPGLGCFAFKYTTIDPSTPAGPRFSDGNGGGVKVDGFSGGVGDTDAGTPPGAIPKPLDCAREEMKAGSNLFNYICNLPPPAGGTSAQRYPACPAGFNNCNGFVIDFLKPTDKIKVTTAGGPDFPATTLEGPSSPYDYSKFTVTNDLWAITAADLDGTNDLTFNYTCEGGPCTMADAVGVHIVTTDATPGADPYDFPGPTTEYGEVLCNDLLVTHPNSYSVPKSVLAQIPGSWTAAFINVRTVTATRTNTASMAIGFGYIGVSRK